jgi:FixJ family two-component response regulator/HAMP domain-containing protein
MSPAGPKRVPWRSWDDFLGWAQDFSLMQKVMGGFLGVAVLVGLLTTIVGTQLARETIIERAKIRVNSDLATADFILKSMLDKLELKIRFAAGSEKIKDLLDKNDYAGVHRRLTQIATDGRLDFLTFTNKQGQVMARAFIRDSRGDVSQDTVVKAGLSGKEMAGIRVLPASQVAQENPALRQRLADKSANECMILEAIHPLTVDGKIVGTIYGGVLVNQNNSIVDTISQRLFQGERYEKVEVGYVTIYQGDGAVATTLLGKDDKPMFVKASDQIRKSVLGKGVTEITWNYHRDSKYLSGAEPIKDFDGKVIGAIELGTLQQPIESVIRSLVGAFLMVGLVGVILMAAISYFIVRWINRPLQQMLHAAKRAAEGDLSHEVPVIARDEVGALAATFNLMIRNLAESQRQLEAWGKELASKVAQQTGELNLAIEQVARVKKLASLEKMADGMAHIMAHISDPMVGLEGREDTSGTTTKIVVMDRDERTLEICQRIFESEGFDVRLTRSVNEALDQLEKEFFDVIITDIDIPDMGGQELLKEIRFRQPDIVVILTAPFKATEEAVEAVKMGAFDYIPKPFGPHQILLMVYTALQTQQMLKTTRRQHAEQRAEKIFQQLPVAIALADDQHRVVYHNRAFVELASLDGDEQINGKTFGELFGLDPLDKTSEEEGGFRWTQLEKVGRTAKLYKFDLHEENLRVLMLLDITDTVIKDQQVDVFKAETISKAQQVIHQQMRVAQEIAGLLGETTAETKAALFELIKLAREGVAR